MLGNIRFIGELYKKKMLKVRPSVLGVLLAL